MVAGLDIAIQHKLASKLPNMILTLLEEVVVDLDENWGGGAMSPAAYDTAWVAMIRSPDNHHELAFKKSFEWLLKNQSDDGSWGFPPQQILPTFAGLLALLKAPQQNELIRFAANKAQIYLENSCRQWSINEHESIGFEILVPALLSELEKYGVVFEFSNKAQLLRLYREKICIASPKLIYSGESTLIHSLEAFAHSIDFQRLKSLKAANGSYGCSPAATAAVLIYGSEWDKSAADWLTHLSNKSCSQNEPGAMPNAYPIDTFESSWVLYNLLHSEVDLEGRIFQASLQKLENWLYKSLTHKGASISRFIGLPTDSDDTGMLLAAYNLLVDKNKAKMFSVECLQTFERDTHFACFEVERGVSLSANAHVLAGLFSTPISSEWVQKNQSINKLIDYLYSVRNSYGYWEDKWHISPFYATSCSVMALAQHTNTFTLDKLQLTVNWVLATQSLKDGGWNSSGSKYSTLEETAYALLILNTIRRKIPEIKPQAALTHAVEKGAYFLWQHIDELYLNKKQMRTNPRLPYLWRGKELYMPRRVVMSAVLAALGQSYRRK